jgi:hypothetical protein
MLAALAGCVAGVFVYGVWRWKRETKYLRARLEAARLPIVPATYDAREIESLPPAVRRYFRAVLQDGQPIVAGVRLSQDGQFRQNEQEDAWRPFKATQVFTTRPPGFDWDARIRMVPGMTAFVHDAYVAGDGLLHAEALGLITVADVRGTPAAAEGELLRYLAEAVWYPTALLPSQGVRWEATDGSAARATLTDGTTTVTLAFCFASEGLITSLKAESRFRGIIDGVTKFAPWHGRFWSYEFRDGMRIPLEGEVAWQMPTGLSPYCRVRVREISYEFAG